MKLVVITGASSGIGAATARLMGSRGFTVVLVARGRSALEDLAAEIGDNAVVETCDASDGEAVLALAERVRREHGVPDVIVNSAGAGAWDWIENTSPEDAVQMMQAPYFAAYNITHAFMNDLLARQSGLIIHVNSPVSFATWPACTSYAAVRWALRGLPRSAVRRFVEHGGAQLSRGLWPSFERLLRAQSGYPREDARYCQDDSNGVAGGVCQA